MCTMIAFLMAIDSLGGTLRVSANMQEAASRADAGPEALGCAFSLCTSPWMADACGGTNTAHVSRILRQLGWNCQRRMRC